MTRLIKNVEEDTSLGLELDDMFALADEELTTLLRGIGGISESASRLVEELMGDLDYVTVYELPATAKQPMVPAKIDAWLNDVTSDEKEMAYILRPESWERAIAQNSIGRERGWQIHVVLPGPGAYQHAESETKLLTKDDRGRYVTVNFFDTSVVVKNTLEQMNVKRQVIRIMCPAMLPAQERELIRSAARAFFETADT